MIRWLPLVIAPALLCAQEAARDRSLEFVKAPTREVVDNVYDGIRSITVSERTIQVKLVLAGKAPPLSTPLLARLKGKDRQLYNEARKIESALKLQQDDKEFYLRVFASVPISELETGKKVSCKVVLLSIETADGVVYLPLIKTVTPLGSRNSRERGTRNSEGEKRSSVNAARNVIRTLKIGTEPGLRQETHAVFQPDGSEFVFRVPPSRPS